MNKTLGYIHFWATFVGVYCVFFPMHYTGIAGFPRRYYSFTALGNGREEAFTDLNMFISIAAILTFSSQAIFAWNFFYSIFKGKKATENPWNSTTLEWTTPIEPGHGNWPGEIPTVYRWAYDYSNPAHEADFMPQNIPDEHSAEELFEKNTSVDPARKDSPVKETVDFFTLLRNWYKPRTV
jgi:cytochrome c oxidase subunit 1